MDFIFLRPLGSVMGKNNVSTVMVKASVDYHDYNNLVYNCGNVISNELFHVKAGHIFLETVMNVFHSTLMSGEYTYNRPMVFTNALDKTCSQKNPHTSLINHGGDHFTTKNWGIPMRPPFFLEFKDFFL